MKFVTESMLCEANLEDPRGGTVRANLSYSWLGGMLGGAQSIHRQSGQHTLLF